MKRSNPVKILVLFMLAFALGACTSDTEDEQQALVENANASAKRFSADPDMAWFREHLDDAEGLLIIPTSIKGGFIIGGSGGSGVMLARRPDIEWSYPAFYTMGSVTFGLQIGGEVQEIVLVIMSKAGRDAMLTNEFKLGADGPRLMEINGRFWGSLPLAYHAGTRFAWLTYAALGLGERPENRRAAVGGGGGAAGVLVELFDGG